MPSTAPRRGCLAPSGRGLWRGAGRRVSSPPPGGARCEPVQRAAPCETDLHSLICGLGRAVSASAKPRARDCIEARFSERTRLPSLAGLWLSSVVRFWHFDYGLLDARWTCPPESVHIGGRYKGKRASRSAARHKLSKHRCARLLDSVISCRAILEVSSGSVSKQAPRGRTTDAWSGRATAARVERAAVLPSRRGLSRHAAGGAAARPANK